MSAPHETGRRGGSRMRLRGLIRKEFLQILRDPSSIAIAFLMPVALLLLFGYGVSLDARHVPVALVAEAPSPATAQFTAAFGHSDYFDARPMAGMRQAREALARGTIRGIVRIPADFAAEVDNPRQAHLQLIVNGVDGNTAGLVEGYVHGVWANWLAQRGTEQALPAQTPLRLDTRIWFNSELRSRNYLVPGLIAVIMTLIGALLTALVMAREWERGTMEALMITPVSMREIIVGKIVPYFVLGTGGMLLSVILALFLFQIPLRGSLAVLFMTSSLFLLAALGMGLLISVVARNQFVAGQLALVVTFLPAFLLSGFIFDIGSMPWVVRVITHLVAARYFVSILQTVF
ncbi:MAG: ABC transporter permease, partial [Gammaproteobacteria bacterium]